MKQFGAGRKRPQKKPEPDKLFNDDINFFGKILMIISKVKQGQLICL
jgi:hypothetical protein